MPSRKEDRLGSVRVQRNDVDTPTPGGFVRLFLEPDDEARLEGLVNAEVRLTFNADEAMKRYGPGTKFRLALEPVDE